MTPATAYGWVVLPAALFATVYFPLVNRLTLALASPYAKADLGRRLSAAVIDALVVSTLLVLYQRTESLVLVAAVALYVLLRDGVQGQSVGKFFSGLVVISLETGKPSTFGGSVRRNLLFLLPGANVAAVALESITIARDPKGQRLGDRLAQTQVVDGLSAKDLATAFVNWWRTFVAGLDGSPRRRKSGRIRT